MLQRGVRRGGQDTCQVPMKCMGSAVLLGAGTCIGHRRMKERRGLKTRHLNPSSLAPEMSSLIPSSDPSGFSSNPACPRRHPWPPHDAVTSLGLNSLQFAHGHSLEPRGVFRGPKPSFPKLLFSLLFQSPSLLTPS